MLENDTAATQNLIHVYCMYNSSQIRRNTTQLGSATKCVH